MEIEDRRYWLDEFGKRIWQNKEDYRVRVIRPKCTSKDVIYEKEGKQVGFGSLSDFMVRINEYYPLGRGFSEIFKVKEKDMLSNSCVDNIFSKFDVIIEYADNNTFYT